MGTEGEADGQPRAVDVKPARLHGRLDPQRLALLHEAGFQRRAPALDAVELAGAELEPVLAERHRLAARGTDAGRGARGRRHPEPGAAVLLGAAAEPQTAEAAWPRASRGPPARL